MKSKKGISAIIVVVIVAILIALAVVGVLFFMKNQSKEPIKDAKQEQITVQPQNDDKKNENTSISTEVVSNQLTKADLSLYNTMLDSRYLTVVMYDPLKDRNGAGDKNDFKNAILVTYDLGDGLKDSLLKGFRQMAENKNTASLKYYYGLVANNAAIYQVTSSNKLTSASARFGEKDIEKDNVLFYKNVHSATISTKVKETKSDDYNIYGTNFHTYSAKTYTDGRKSTDLIYLNVGEIEDKTKNVSVAIRLNKSVPYGSTFVNTVENAIKAGDFKDTITLLEDTDNLGNVSKRFGKTVDLNSTIFYQDVIATEIAEKYGLNVRNKDFYLMTDAKYIVYKAYGEDNYLTEVKFVRSTTNYEYTTISSRLESSAFNYKDAEGNEYSYFADNTKGYLYVFKNQQYVGTLEVTHRIGASQDVFNHVNYIFGIK